ncbi:MAG: hypothetical protein QXM76_05070 [Zestosphaera sp.]
MYDVYTEFLISSIHILILTIKTFVFTISPTSYTWLAVSAKIPKRLKELLDRYSIKPSPVIRRALEEEEVKKRMVEELEELSGELSRELTQISDEEVVELIREDREGR